MSQLQTEDITKLFQSLIPENIPDESRVKLQEDIDKLATGLNLTNQQADEMTRLARLLEFEEKNKDVAGFHRWFVPGTVFGIDRLPKHSAFFESTRLHRETLMLGGNRCGKTRAGAMVSAILATGEYPDWWKGVRWDTPTHIWAAGKTGQTTRDTVQDAILGPMGGWGTGALPERTIIDTSARQGIAGAVDIIRVRHVSGGESTIGFKSFDQKPNSFFGTARHLVWLDEPAPELVYHEMLMRTMMLKDNCINGPAGGRLIHTITPKEGLTQLLSSFLRSCELLAGAQRVKGLEAIAALEDMDNTDEYGFKRDN